MATDIQEWLMLMQIWGHHEMFLNETASKHRLLAHNNLLVCCSLISAEKLMIEDLFTQHLIKDKSLLQNLTKIEQLLNLIISKFTLHFNGKVDILPKQDQLENYANPNSEQIGSLVEVNVGHIERFKLNEEL